MGVVEGAVEVLVVEAGVGPLQVVKLESGDPVRMVTGLHSALQGPPESGSHYLLTPDPGHWVPGGSGAERLPPSP